MNKTLTVRLPHRLYDAARAAAQRRDISLNALVQQGLENISKQEEEEKLYEAFGMLGSDADEADVEFAIPAQREVVGREGRISKGKRKPQTR
jgi:hypothetical protein